jgi:hypothetical protein
MFAWFGVMLTLQLKLSVESVLNYHETESSKGLFKQPRHETETLEIITFRQINNDFQQSSGTRLLHRISDPLTHDRLSKQVIDPLDCRIALLSSWP